MTSHHLSRRALIIGAGTGLGAFSAAGATAATLGASPLPCLAAPVSQDLVAVRVFPTYRGSVYGQHEAVLARLRELGIRRISHKISSTMDPATIAFTQRAYRELGIRSWLTVGEPRVPLTPVQWDRIVALLRGPLAGAVERCFGWNEPNHVRGGGAALPGDWHVQTAAHQAELWRRVSPLGIAVGTPQLWSGDFGQHAADLALLAPLIMGHFNQIAWHLYPRGGTGIPLLERFEDTYQSVLGAYPVVCTEAGFFTAPNYSGGARVVTEPAQATLLARLIDSYVERGYGLSLFELLDDPDPTGANREASFGLVRCPSVDPASWSPKPAFAAVRSRLV